MQPRCPHYPPTHPPNPPTTPRPNEHRRRKTNQAPPTPSARSCLYNSISQVSPCRSPTNLVTANRCLRVAQPVPRAPTTTPMPPTTTKDHHERGRSLHRTQSASQELTPRRALPALLALVLAGNARAQDGCCATVRVHSGAGQIGYFTQLVPSSGTRPS